MASRETIDLAPPTELLRDFSLDEEAATHLFALDELERGESLLTGKKFVTGSSLAGHGIAELAYHSEEELASEDETQTRDSVSITISTGSHDRRRKNMSRFMR